MSRRSDYTLEFDAPAEKVYQDFTSRDYWHTLMDSYLAVIPRSEVTSFHTDDRGTHIEFVHIVPRDYLPPIGRSILLVDLVITRKQHFGPFDHAAACAEGTYSASIPRAPGSFRGQYTLRETDDGSALRLASECKVHIPLIGGSLEGMILDGMKDILDSERAFTADWISKYH